MRQVTQQAASVFIAVQPFASGNTCVTVDKDHPRVGMYLHGNLIAEKTVNGTRGTLAGWPTPTTRERLNGLLTALGVEGSGFYQLEHEQYYDGLPVDANEWVTI
jgi:hypothetical protein